MTYDNVTRAFFLDRPNRFVARVRLGNTIETVHVKNTGRCRELLLPGAEVWLTKSSAAGRKTNYDLVVVRKENGGLFNIDSQAANKVAYEWLLTQGMDLIRPEYRFGDSRIDFYLQQGKNQYLMEVKGCTLEMNGVGYFPDAPTQRGVKHLRELMKAVDAGYHAILAYVIQMDRVTEVRANTKTHPEYGEVLEEAKRFGVRVLCLPCHVEPDSLTVVQDAVEGSWK